ncbi:MAG TPA: hypothetical protein VEQ40_06905 [Pyrinomonadaceae bacterium]|nr:hypothetical protein [Pyrinomonadaceae bacterium]
MKAKLALVGLLLLSVQNIFAHQKPSLPEIDRIRLAEAFRIGERLGNRVWKDWDKAPFAVLLVTPDNEFLVRHPRPSQDFTLAGYDSLLKSDIYFRRRTQRIDYLATFPAVGGIPTIVIGQAENTSQKSSTPWVVTVLHEHFHQLQMSQPNYYQAVNELNLSRGDQTGMWMLNYAFPYSAPEVKQHFNALSTSLVKALQAKTRTDLSAKLAAYLETRRQFAGLLKPADYKYFSFQVWQEGFARYTEYRVAALAANNYTPSREFRALQDYLPFDAVADKIMKNILVELATLKLEDQQRVAFYPIGAAEALLLDRVNANWRSLYFTDKFFVDKYFITAR